MADILPLGFMFDDDKLGRNDSWRREENQEGVYESSKGCQLPLTCHRAGPGERCERGRGGCVVAHSTEVQCKNPETLMKIKFFYPISKVFMSYSCLITAGHSSTQPILEYSFKIAMKIWTHLCHNTMILEFPALRTISFPLKMLFALPCSAETRNTRGLLSIPDTYKIDSIKNFCVRTQGPKDLGHLLLHSQVH